jgi:hypothetical protein
MLTVLVEAQANGDFQDPKVRVEFKVGPETCFSEGQIGNRAVF